MEPSRLLVRLEDPEQQLLDRLTIQPIGDTFVEQETSVISEEDLWKLEMLEQAIKIIDRAQGIYGGNLPGNVEIWIFEGIFRR